MEWMAIIGDSIQYIEEHITEDVKGSRRITILFSEGICHALWIQRG